LNYQRSRLVRSWTHLERQRGGLRLHGRPGGRQIGGPPADRRPHHADRERFEEGSGDAAATPPASGELPYRVVALVGYTNAGKSTLFNR
jgi:GTP-binding protein HflX